MFTAAAAVPIRRPSKAVNHLLSLSFRGGNRFPSVFLQRDQEKALAKGVRRLPQSAFDRLGLDTLVKNCAPGEIVEVRDVRKTLLGYGFLESAVPSEARVDVFELRHRGSAGELLLIDEAYWIQKFRRALEYRRRHCIGAETNAFRVVNGGADGAPGLLLDTFGGITRVAASTSGAESLLSTAIKFSKLEGVGVAPFVCTRDSCGEAYTTAPGPIDSVAHESGLQFLTSDLMLVDAVGERVTFQTANTTPFTLRPQYRTVRRLFRELCEGKVVLDLGSSAAAFALNAVTTADHVIYCHPSSFACSVISQILEFQFRGCTQRAAAAKSGAVDVQNSGVNDNRWDRFGAVDIAVVEGNTGWIDRPGDWERVLRSLLPVMRSGGHLVLVGSTAFATESVGGFPGAALQSAASATQRSVILERSFSLSPDFPVAPAAVDESQSIGFAALVRVI